MNQMRLCAAEEAEALDIENAVNKIVGMPQVTTIDYGDKTSIFNGTCEELTITVTTSSGKVIIKDGFDGLQVSTEALDTAMLNAGSVNSASLATQHLSAPIADIEHLAAQHIDIQPNEYSNNYNSYQTGKIATPYVKLKPIEEGQIPFEEGVMYYDKNRRCFRLCTNYKWVSIGSD